MVPACQGIGVSVALIALEHTLNANLLRRWMLRRRVDFLRDCWVVRQPLCRWHGKHY